MSATVVVPWRGGCPHRERALEWMLGRYREKHSDWTVVVCEYNGGEWVKAHAITPAAFDAKTEIVVVADADVWCDQIGAAVAAVERGEPWAMPHEQVHRLTEESTAKVLAGAQDWGALKLEEHNYKGILGGGIVVAARATLLDIPPDPRFQGWGCEDISWALALHCLMGPRWRGSAPLWHLWHPPDLRAAATGRSRGSDASQTLYLRYRRAKRQPDVMRALIEEGRDGNDRQSAHPVLHDRAPHERRGRPRRAA